MALLNASKALMELLKGYGVGEVFGLPGETTLPWYREWMSTPEVKHVMMRDERSAAFAADAFARFSFKPGICEGPSVGATHMIPGVAEAYKASIPMLVFTSDIPLHFEKRNTLTGIDHTAMFEGITKESLTVTEASELPNIVRRAFRLATSGKPGPVHIRFPSDKQGEDIGEPRLFVQEDFKVYPGHRPVAELAKLSEALRVLGSAQRPVIVCGQGVLLSQAWGEVQVLAELFGIPVGTTINGKGAFPENHPLSIGVTGSRGGSALGNKVINEADVIFYVGCSTDSTGTDMWKTPSLDTQAKIIHLDVSEAEVGNNYPLEVALIGDAAATLRVMVEVAEKQEKKVRKLPRIKAIQKERAEYDAYAAGLMASNEVPIHPLRFVKELGDALPKDYALVTDVGVAAIYASAFLKQGEAGRRMIFNYAMGSLGYAIPASIGARYARPDSAVITLVGDGSFGFTAGELETVARVGGPNHIILLNNFSFGWIRAEWQFSYGKEYVDFATNFKPVDYMKIADGYGLDATRVGKPEELGPSLRRNLKKKDPTFTEIIVKPEDKLVPPVSRWIKKAKEQGIPHVE
ncbi:MAG: thiamine pyrophosphate-binding protein [Candidatus Bathyarchaeota archaeon]|nr:thiamine pyrophosphate-binding protein [Candidatus Bathyarchaeota archaeon]